MFESKKGQECIYTVNERKTQKYISPVILGLNPKLICLKLTI